MRSILKTSVCVALCSASLAFAQFPPPPPPPPPLPADPVPIPLTVSGNQVQGTIDLPGGIGADLTITFESVVGLTPTALEAWASVVNPLDPALLTRFPGVGQVGVPAAFPVLLRIDPSAASGLSFTGVYTIALHTFNLEFDPAVPLTLFKSPDGGQFADIQKAEGRGSYRDDGGGGDFSEFMIVIDSRPIDTIIVSKFDALQAALTNNGGSMPADVLSTLQGMLSQARTLYQSGAPKGAIGVMTAFTQYVKTHSGQDIPDVWRANDPNRINVAGLLRSGADTLKFSLDKSSH